MTVIDLHNLKECDPPHCTVLCLGNFDGVHKGHRALIQETVKLKNQLSSRYPDIKSGAWFFERAPLEVISGSTVPMLSDLDRKLRIFSSLGLDFAFICSFEDIGGLSPEAFVADILKKDCGCIFAVCGYNFRFGKNAAGSPDTLNDLMEGNSLTVNEISYNGKAVSSSLIRNYIAEGCIEEANALLQRNYSFSAEVIYGKQLGRTLGIPTINQLLPKGLAAPQNGIYISYAVINGKRYKSVTNFGCRPSVNDGSFINCETHIIDFNGDLYGQVVEIEFIKIIRREKKFDSVDALKEQILNDILEAKEYFKSKEA